MKRKTVGKILVTIPFVLLFALSATNMGIGPALVVYGFAGAIIACVHYGAKFLSGN